MAVQRGAQALPETSLDLQILVQDNKQLLSQLDALLCALDDSHYTNNESALFDSALGLHVRHMLDHYDCFIRGLADKCIDYDSRERDVRVEAGTDFARERLRRLSNALDQLPRENQAVTVLQSSSGDTANRQPLASSLARELVFLHSHSIHHQASISSLLRALGASELEPVDFGIAPATCQHQEATGCAR
ncbi:MAG: DinB family protein [Gammaproteobacteria bacterium]|nr:DinB family protein [Gammaproteobacteria bacterium]MBT8150202.1 DinB family protein [Gammaproteobacteria bacterium]NND40122.1 hypothetical protein [Pseudomonadales bacterium]